MKHTLTSLALAGALALGLGAVPAFAQDDTPPSPPPMGQTGGHRHAPNPERQLKHLTRALDLTADQQTQLMPILEAQDQKMTALWQNDSLSPQDRRSQMRQLHQDSKAQIEAVLTDAQKQKYEQMEQERMEHMRQMRQGGPPPDQDQQPQV